MEENYKKRCESLESNISQQQAEMTRQGKEISNLMVYKNGYDEIQKSKRSLCSSSLIWAFELSRSSDSLEFEPSLSDEFSKNRKKQVFMNRRVGDIGLEVSSLGVYFHFNELFSLFKEPSDVGHPERQEDRRANSYSDEHFDGRVRQVLREAPEAGGRKAGERFRDRIQRGVVLDELELEPEPVRIELAHSQAKRCGAKDPQPRGTQLRLCS